MIDLTKQIPERGYFQPSETMLRLIDDFIYALNTAIDNEIRLQKLHSKTLIFIMLDTSLAEVYSILNNGIEVSWQYQGTHNANIGAR